MHEVRCTPTSLLLCTGPALAAGVPAGGPRRGQRCRLCGSGNGRCEWGQDHNAQGKGGRLCGAHPDRMAPRPPWEQVRRLPLKPQPDLSCEPVSAPQPRPPVTTPCLEAPPWAHQRAPPLTLAVHVSQQSTQVLRGGSVLEATRAGRSLFRHPGLAEGLGGRSPPEHSGIEPHSLSPELSRELPAARVSWRRSPRQDASARLRWDPSLGPVGASDPGLRGLGVGPSPCLSPFEGSSFALRARPLRSPSPSPRDGREEPPRALAFALAMPSAARCGLTALPPGAPGPEQGPRASEPTSPSPRLPGVLLLRCQPWAISRGSLRRGCCVERRVHLPVSAGVHITVLVQVPSSTADPGRRQMVTRVL